MIELNNEVNTVCELKSENFEFQCRLCLRHSQLCYSIFDEDITDVIENLTSIKISEDDEFPSTCCSECLEDVHKANAMRTRIIESDKILRSNKNTVSGTFSKNLDSVGNAPGTVAVKEENACANSSKNTEVNLTCDSNKAISLHHNVENTFSHENASSPKFTINPELNVSLRKRLEIKQKQTQNSSILSAPQRVNVISITQTARQSDDIFSCYECVSKIKGKINFTNHLQSHDLTICKICGTHLIQLGPKSVSNYLRHMDIHFSGPQICEICGAVAKNAESLRGHMFYMHKSSDKKYKCDKCNMFFKYKYKYGLHIQKHHVGNTTHMCEMCGKGFFTNFAVRKHIKMKHLKMRPYVCEYCNKGFSSRYARRTHVRQHTNETPFICYICSDGFRQKVSLKTHLKSKHGINNLEERVDHEDNTANEIHGNN